MVADESDRWRHGAIPSSRLRPMRPQDAVDVGPIDAGQTWVSTVDGSIVVVEGRSTLLAGWWKIRSASAGWSRTMEEETLRSLYRLEPVETVCRLDEGDVVGQL